MEPLVCLKSTPLNELSYKHLQNWKGRTYQALPPGGSARAQRQGQGDEERALGIPFTLQVSEEKL